MANGKAWLRAGLLIAALWLAWMLHELLILIAIALLVSAALSPVVTRLNRLGAPQVLSASVTMLGLLGLLVGFGFYLAPAILDQADQFGEMLPTLSDRLDRFEAQWRGWREQTPLIPRFQEVTAWIQSQTTGVLASAIGITGGFVLLLFSLVSVLFLSFFFLMEGKRLREQTLSLVPARHRDRTRQVAEAIMQQVGRYMLGRLLVMIAVGILTGLGLWLLGVPYAMLLAAIAGLLDIVPFIGPLLAAVPGVLVGFGQSPEKALWIGLMYWGVQSIESYVLSPFILGHSVKVHPVWIFVALLAGESLLGLVGMILSVPAAVAIQVLIREVYRPAIAGPEPAVSEPASRPEPQSGEG